MVLNVFIVQFLPSRHFAVPVNRVFHLNSSPYTAHPKAQASQIR